MCLPEDSNRPQEEKMDSYVDKVQLKKEYSVLDPAKQNNHISG